MQSERQRSSPGNLGKPPIDVEEAPPGGAEGLVVDSARLPCGTPTLLNSLLKICRKDNHASLHCLQFARPPAQYYESRYVGR